MPQRYQRPEYGQRFSTQYLLTRPGQHGALLNDMAPPPGGVNSADLFGGTGTGTTDATVGTTMAIAHDLGVVPAVGEIVLTPMGNGVVYLDPDHPPTATTFNVLGSAASLPFAWMILTTWPHPGQAPV